MLWIACQNWCTDCSNNSVLDQSIFQSYLCKWWIWVRISGRLSSLLDEIGSIVGLEVPTAVQYSSDRAIRLLLTSGRYLGIFRGRTGSNVVISWGNSQHQFSVLCSSLSSRSKVFVVGHSQQLLLRQFDKLCSIIRSYMVSSIRCHSHELHDRGCLRNGKIDLCPYGKDPPLALW